MSFLLTIALLMLPTSAWALEPEAQAAREEGMRLYNIGHSTAALPYLRQAAQAGDVDAMYYMGEAERRQNMMGMTQAAMDWYLQAAVQGDVCAMLRLFQGGACIAGDVCPEGHEDWHHAALAVAKPQAEAGDPDAMLALFNTYRMFDEMGQANEWLERAAEAGQPEAQTIMGKQILNGRGWYLTNGRRLGAAEEWFRKAAEQEYVPAMEKLSEVLSNQQRYEEAWRWTRDASRSGHLDSRLWEAFCFLDPEYDPICSVDQNIEKGWGLALSAINETDNDTARWVLEENDSLLADRYCEGAAQIAEEWIDREPPLSNFPPRFGY